ncbi:MAG: hypothetical protein K6F50_01790 [Kiritimatiellae bacterium]|nr:hypothetical protein [Kiritimatiellia bacterium]
MRPLHSIRLAALVFSVVGAVVAQDSQWRQSPPLGIAVGDLVFRKGEGTWTPYFIGVSTREKRFSHVGIVDSAKDGKVVILHADADDSTGIGCVRKENWSGFFAEALEGAVYRYDGSAQTAVRFAEEGRTKLGTPFDRAFDMSTPDKLYCTEYVRGALNAAAGKELVGCTIVSGKPFVAIDDIYHHDFTKIWDSETSAGNVAARSGLPENGSR